MHRIMLIEDEQSIADTVIHTIEREGYVAAWYAEGLPGLESLAHEDYSLIILDVGLPDINGFELCKKIRKISEAPIIFLTARDDEIDKIVGLEIGADDYVTKPFSPRELGARIKTILRRSGHASPQPPVVPGSPTGEMPPRSPESPIPDGSLNQGLTRRLHIDHDKMLAVYCGTKLELTRYEFKLLTLLADRPGHVYTREFLMQHVWDNDSPSMDRTVDTHIKSLRAKCREVDDTVDPVLTRRGIGYAFRDDL